MKKLGLAVVALFALLGAASPADLANNSDPAQLSTERKVHGVITSIEPSAMTLTSEKSAVTGKIDPVRTKVTQNGHPATIADLKLTAHAKGELCLEDVWLVIDTH